MLVYPFPLWWSREYIHCLIIIIKSEMWTIIHCYRIGYETMVCAVCLYILMMHMINYLITYLFSLSSSNVTYLLHRIACVVYIYCSTSPDLYLGFPSAYFLLQPENVSWHSFKYNWFCKSPFSICWQCSRSPLCQQPSRIGCYIWSGIKPVWVSGFMGLERASLYSPYRFIHIISYTGRKYN